MSADAAQLDVRHLRVSRVRAVANQQLASPAVSRPASAATSPSSATHSLPSAAPPQPPHPPLPAYLPHRVTSPLDEEIVQPPPDDRPAPPSSRHAQLPDRSTAPLPSRPHRRQLSAEPTSASADPLPHTRTASREPYRNATAVTAGQRQQTAALSVAVSSSSHSALSPSPSSAAPPSMPSPSPSLMLQSFLAAVRGGSVGSSGVGAGGSRGSGSDDSASNAADEDSDDESAAREKTSLLRHSPSPATAARKTSPPSFPALPPAASHSSGLQLTPPASLAAAGAGNGSKRRPGSPSFSPSAASSGRLSSSGHHLRRSVSVSSSRAAALNLHDKSRIPLVRIMALSSYWFGWSFLWLPLLIVIVPTQAKQFVGDAGKGAALSQILMLGSVVSVAAAPLLGSYSDSCTHWYGRRRPFMIAGTVLASVSLLLLAVAPSLSFFSASFALLSFANNMIIAPYSALVPDIVPLEQRGVASGYLGLFSMLGNLAGGMLGALQSTLGLPLVYLTLLAVHGGCMWVTCRWTAEEQLVLDEYEPMDAKYTPASLDGRRPPPTGCSRVASLFRPFLSHDFRVVFFTRFVMQLGVLTVQEYLLYYLSDEIGTRVQDGSGEQHFVAFGSLLARSDEQAVTLLFGPVLVGAIVSSVVAGLLSDWMGGKRKKLLYVSGGVMCVSGFLFAVTRSYSVDLLLGGLFGLGFGAFSVLDWALAADVLPDPEMFAKDMGLWSLALVMPQVLAAPLAGGVLDACVRVNQGSVGYSIIFLMAALYFLLGTVFVKSLEGVD